MLVTRSQSGSGRNTDYPARLIGTSALAVVIVSTCNPLHSITVHILRISATAWAASHLTQSATKILVPVIHATPPHRMTSARCWRRRPSTLTIASSASPTPRPCWSAAERADQDLPDLHTAARLTNPDSQLRCVAAFLGAGGLQRSWGLVTAGWPSAGCTWGQQCANLQHAAALHGCASLGDSLVCPKMSWMCWVGVPRFPRQLTTLFKLASVASRVHTRVCACALWPNGLKR